MDGSSTTSNVFSMQPGGCVDAPLTHGSGLRVIGAEYVHTVLPNNASNNQNDLRLAVDVSCRLR